MEGRKTRVIQYLVKKERNAMENGIVLEIEFPMNGWINSIE